MTPSCACGKPSPDAFLCHDCTAALAAVLLDIPGGDGLAYHLDIALARLARFTDAGHSRGHVAVLPYDVRAAEAAGQLRGVLVAWVRDLNETLWGERHRWPRDTLPAMALWLYARLAQVRQHEAAALLKGEITEAVERGWQIVNRPAPRVYGGPCPVCRTDLLTQPGRPHVTCTGCGAVHDIAERQASMRDQLDDQLVTAVYASAILPGLLPGIHVSESVIRGWAFRHRLEVRSIVPPKYHGQPSQPLYRFRDIVDLALERDATKSRLTWDNEVPASA